MEKRLFFLLLQADLHSGWDTYGPSGPASKYERCRPSSPAVPCFTVLSFFELFRKPCVETSVLVFLVFCWRFVTLVFCRYLLGDIAVPQNRSAFQKWNGLTVDTTRVSTESLHFPRGTMRSGTIWPVSICGHYI